MIEEHYISTLLYTRYQVITLPQCDKNIKYSLMLLILITI